MDANPSSKVVAGKPKRAEDKSINGGGASLSALEVIFNIQTLL
jgi:hypothetical protein